MKRLSVLFALMASPALAASGPFFSLRNTDFIVTMAFLLFVAILVYYKVPGIIGGLLDKRAEGIRNDLAEARRLREEAQELRALFDDLAARHPGVDTLSMGMSDDFPVWIAEGATSAVASPRMASTTIISNSVKPA